MEIASLYNPYDFANPVADANLFIGRHEELNDIKYYLDHAKTAPRPINLAVLGPRASGKTSLLNMIELEAQKRKEYPVRIDLDEDDVTSQLRFFLKLFDGILTVACTNGAFGGKEGKTFDVYLDMVNAFSIPEEKDFCPFVFPIQYAKAMSSGNVNAVLSDGNFKQDLQRIRHELDAPIIILFDEGNVLANSRSLLQKMRNIFMNTPGFMLVLTGTPDLFPVMDEVFSPIVRQFKKISVGEFKKTDETKDCIRKPLEKIGVKPEEIFDFNTLREVEEIHNLSGGRPYEIQLICFVLFKRVQSKRARRMRLDLSVLEEVRKELETSQDISARPLLTKIRNLTKKHLSGLKLLCSCDGNATIDQLWAIEFICKGNNRWTQDDLNRELEFFAASDVVNVEDGVIKFKGDDFDKIYTRYFAREQRISLQFEGYPLQLYWFVRFSSHLASFETLEIMPESLEVGPVSDLSQMADRLASSNFDDDVFVEEFSWAQALYPLMIAYENQPTLPIVTVHLIFPWLNVHLEYFTREPRNVATLDQSLKTFQLLADRAKEVGGSLTFEKRSIVVTPLEILAAKMERTANQRLRSWMADYHAMQMADRYISNAESKEVLFHAELSLRYNPEPESPFANNIGYVMMAFGRYDIALRLFELDQHSGSGDVEPPLSRYNLGVLQAKLGNIDSALHFVTESKQSAETLKERQRGCQCLFVPKLIDGQLAFEEYKEGVDLLRVTTEAEQNLKLYSETKGTNR